LNKKAIIIILGAVLVIFFIRMIYSQHIYMKKAEKAESIEKVKELEKVILFHFPLSPYTKKAVDEMIKKCKNFKEDREKLYCYETLRSALFQIRSFSEPYKNLLDEINPEIAHLRAVEMIKWKDNGFSVKDYQNLYSYHLNLLKHENAPSKLWSLLVIFSLSGWIGAVFLIIFKGLKSPLDKKYLLIGIAGFVVFFTLWILGLYMA